MEKWIDTYRDEASAISMGTAMGAFQCNLAVLWSRSMGDRDFLLMVIVLALAPVLIGANEALKTFLAGLAKDEQRRAQLEKIMKGASLAGLVGFFILFRIFILG